MRAPVRRVGPARPRRSAAPSERQPQSSRPRSTTSRAGLGSLCRRGSRCAAGARGTRPGVRRRSLAPCTFRRSRGPQAGRRSSTCRVGEPQRGDRACPGEDGEPSGNDGRDGNTNREEPLHGRPGWGGSGWLNGRVRHMARLAPHRNALPLTVASGVREAATQARAPTPPHRRRPLPHRRRAHRRSRHDAGDVVRPTTCVGKAEETRHGRIAVGLGRSTSPTISSSRTAVRPSEQMR